MTWRSELLQRLQEVRGNCKTRNQLNDIGLGYVAKLETKRLNEMVKRSLIPALDLVKGQAVSHYEIDGDGNLVFFHITGCKFY